MYFCSDIIINPFNSNLTETKMRLAIIGSRTCPPLDIMSHLNRLPSAIVSGGARGADTYAREFAQRYDLPILEFLPQYDKYPPKVAPLMRNKQIVEACDCLIAFWDGQSRGTKYTIDYARKRGKPIKVVNYLTNESYRL